MTTAKVPIDDLASWIGGNPEIASRVVELMEQGKLRAEILDGLCDECQEWKDAPKLPEYLLMDDEFLTDFHKVWNEACVNLWVISPKIKASLIHYQDNSRF